MTTQEALAGNLKRFCRISKEISDDFKKFDLNNLTKTDKEKINRKLSQYLLNPKYTECVVNYFRRDFLNILSQAINLNDGSPFQHNDNVRNVVLLAKLLDLHPDTESFVLKYFDNSPSPFDTTKQVASIPKRRKVEKSTTIEDVDIVNACYQLLQFNPNFFKTKWNWSDFFEKYAKNGDPMVRYLYCRCVALYAGMNEAQLHQYLNSVIPKDTIIDCSIKHNQRTETQSLAPSHNNDFELNIVNDNVIYVNGIYLPVHDKVKRSEDGGLVEVDSTKRNLRRLALGIATNKAVNVTGPVGSGKTSLVEYLAAKTGRVIGESFIKVQLGDQTDSKMLLGTYRCTDIPGEFVWQPGVLTQAVLDGSWLILEDIDSASMDIASVLCGLIENHYLTVPGFRDFMPITPGFQLFVTQRLITTITGHHKKHSGASTLLEKHVLTVNVEPLSSSELLEIIRTKHPILKTTSGRIVEVFNLFNRTDRTVPRSGRLISTRDLFKWCSRAIIDFDVSSQTSALRVLQDAIDIFCCSYSNIEDRLNLAREISTHLGIVNDKANYFCQQYKPHLSLANGCLRVGRALINCVETYTNKVAKFCFTRPSACLLERIVCCITMREPVLLVGETGTGKTSSVQYLAHTLGQKLVVINMNQQSDSADLLGGYKPVDLKFIVAPIKTQFEDVFKSYFNVESNRKFLSNLNYCFNEKQWVMLVKLMKKSYEAAMTRLNVTVTEKELRKSWSEIGIKILKLESQLKYVNALAFAFIEGSLVKAVEKGYWVLLDEINLANAETLECLSGLLEGSDSSLNLLERGDKKPIKRHPNFTLFACMNPSTDVGKKDLPAGLRNRFTEFFVEELTDRIDLMLLVNSYLEAMSLSPEKLENIVKFYLNVRKEAVHSLSDGLGHKPHFSLRSLCRALMISARNPCGMFTRSLYESFCMSFLTQLDAPSYKLVEAMVAKYLIGSSKDVKAVLKQPIMEPKLPGIHLQFEDYWISKGQLESVILEDYILTQSVRRNLKDLARVVSIGRLPVLLQGDTSVGKTSLITYLAKASGYKCVRINNHEHTDLQEYVGSYVASSDGKLEFSEGLLVQAMREGHWIILDELNLAPTDVLEALNRVLDDNRELFIPETQEIVKAHPNFMLFATQNPPGAYGGRKMLSRAFRNRFVELHFTEIPHDELEFILHKRCQMPPSYAKKMINVMKDLQTRRRGSAAFAGKHGFITLRDLFRWGERYRLTENVSSLYDWDQHLADEGYLLLAGRVRKAQEREDIAAAIQKHMKRTITPENLFTLSEKTSTVTKPILEKILANKQKHKNIVWTYNTRQLAVLVCKALQFREPVLLVGETGGGKTTVCSLIAENNGQRLSTLNCHMHTESSDFIGGLRPVRDHTEENLNKLFEWVDGPLVQAMQRGDLFLADEISLADDSVLERLNSLLEPERTLLIAEKGSNENDAELIVAHENFHFIGTMNPGGDFGKKELSPALRNRFTEIWCESCGNRQDLIDIVEHNLREGVTFDPRNDTSNIGNNIMDFIDWFKLQEIGKRFTISIRDILTWVAFINECSAKTGTPDAYLHGACLTFLDSLGSGVTSMESTTVLSKFRDDCLNFIKNQIKCDKSVEVFGPVAKIVRQSDQFGTTPFFIKMGNADEEKYEFSFNAPTTVYNALRLLRGLQLNKAILLEGSPGVGKTSLVTAVAKATRNKLFRINLSDQTDISDLFGADLPVEGGAAGQFSWKDGPLLQALKRGHWILLDELNLASQSVLEGLNACLDHRGEIFIPELGKTFHVKPGTKFFACQNPLKQGGSRRGLPQSFLNRFTQVYLTGLKDKDFFHILRLQFPALSTTTIKKMIDFNAALNGELEEHTFGHKGAPWEFNLRDLTRWCEATIYQRNYSQTSRPENLVKLVFVDRMRTLIDKRKIEEIFESIFGIKIGGDSPVCYVTEDEVKIGDVKLSRNVAGCNVNILKQDGNCLVLRNQLHVLRSLAYCVNLNWMCILVGTADSGKSGVVRTLGKLCGKTVRTLSVTSAMDTTDILGGFEQADYTRHFEELIKRTEVLLLEIFQKLFINGQSEVAIKHLERWEVCTVKFREEHKNLTIAEETEIFLKNVRRVEKILLDASSEIEIVETSVKEELEKLVEKSRTIIGKVESEKSLNAGGKFEWVDSVLVKCLQDGTWLLVDNVNLCSPAVLDRLNALLEPNGVLTIGERGVDENGKMVEIKPHPQFRLFLTMDPKNGDISRAMRNRGLEIYMLNTEESGHRNDIDTESLIREQGLIEKHHVRGLLKIHDYVGDLVLGEKPNMGDLLQAAFLIAQQLLRGTGHVDAYKNVVLDIYCNNKFASEYSVLEIKNSVSEEIERILKLDESVSGSKTHESIPKSNENNSVALKDNLKIDVDKSGVVTLKTRNLETDSQLEHVNQQLVLFKEFKENSELCKFLFLHAMTITTEQDLQLRQKCLQLTFNDLQLKQKHLSKKYEDLLTSAVKIFSNYKLHPSLPIDHRWLPDTLYTHKNSSCNKLFLCLYYVTSITLDEQDDEQKVAQKGVKSFTLLHYLKSIRRKEMEHKIDDPVLMNILDLLEKFDIGLLNLHIAPEFDNEATVQTICLLQFRFFLYEFLKLKLNSVNQINDNVLNKLHVLYRWFVKFSVGQAMRMFLHEDLGEIITKINSKMAHHFSLLRKLGKRYQKCLRKPPPLINECQMEVLPKIHAICEKYDLYNKRQDFNETVRFILNNPEHRSLAIQARSAVNFEFSTIPQVVTEFLENSKITLNENNVPPTDITILPIVDYFCVLKIMKHRHDININDLRSYQTVPVNLIAVLAKFRESDDDRLLHELCMEIGYYLRHSACLAPKKFFGTSEDVKELKSLSLHLPVLGYLMSTVVLDANQKNGIVPTRLGSYREVLKQNKSIHSLLWKNMKEICNYNYNTCEIGYLKTSVSTFLKDFAGSLNITDSTNEQLYEKILQSLKAFWEGTSANRTIEMQEFYKLFEFLQLCDSTLPDGSTEYEVLQTISNVYIVLSYMKALLNSKLPFVDALTKVAMKKEQCTKSIAHLRCLVDSFTMQNEIYSDSKKSLHPLCGDAENKVVQLERENVELGKYVAVRPKNIEYQVILKMISHGFSTALSAQKLCDVYETTNKATTILVDVITNDKEINPKLPEGAILLITSTISSYDNFVDNLKLHRSTYPDIVEPLLCNLTELIHGFNLKLSLIRKLMLQINNKRLKVDLNVDLLNFVKLPVLDETRDDYRRIVCGYIGDGMRNFVTSTFEEDENVSSSRENFKLLKCGLIELTNLCHLDVKYTQYLDKELFSQIDSLLQVFIKSWKKQEEDKAARKIEEESIYKMQTKCDDKSEDEVAEEEFVQLFPSYHDTDFADLQPERLEDSPMEISPTEYSTEITRDDLHFISEYHSDIMLAHTKTEWFIPTYGSNYQLDYITPILQKSKMFKLLMHKLVESLNFAMDHEIVSSLNVLVAIAKNFGDCSFLGGNHDDKFSSGYNFYKDSNLDEVKSCYHVLEELRLKINELLAEWPDHPTLQAINTIIDRIYNFDITSPVPRFLTGFDILLSKCYEWEQNAHSGVSLAQYSANISYQMIQWRKLEMKNWKQALDNCEQRLLASSSTHWFYLYEIMLEYIELKNTDQQELISLLQKFIIQSNIVEFQTRLNLLLVFHCHATFLPKSKERDSFVSILWNLYKHYEQFVPNVMTKMKNVKAPIDKKLKDFVKIVRWKDINYWALKETLLKTHKAIHKFMREYDESLKQPASPFFTNVFHTDELVGVQDRPQRTSPKRYHYTLDSSLYLSKLPLNIVVEEGDVGVISKFNKYFKVCKNLCFKVIKQSEYPQLVKKLDCFIGLVITTSKYLQSMEITTTLPKEKQVSQAKGHLQQKQRGLSDLFKALTKIGLSFRKGIVELKQKDATADFLIKPIDLSAALAYIPRNRSDDKLLILWDGAEVYYRKSFMRMEILEEALKNPSKDLGMQNIERCKGFGAHLMNFVQKQKVRLIENVNILYQLRYYQTVLHESQELAKYVHVEKFKNMQKTLKNIIITMEQYKMIFSACPEEDTLGSEVVNLPSLANTDFMESKGDPLWKKIMDHTVRSIEVAEKILTSLQKVKFNVPCVHKKLLTTKYVYVPNLDQIIEDFSGINSHLSTIRDYFGDIPMMNSLEWIVNEIQRIPDSLIADDVDSIKTIEQFKMNVEKTVVKILVAIQNIHGKYVGAQQGSPESEEKEDVDLLDNHLDELLVQNIFKDFDVLNMGNVLVAIKSVVISVLDANLSRLKVHQRLVGYILPFYDQAILLYQYFVTQLVSVYRTTCKTTSILLNIFIDLATKGFCIPAELSDEMGDSKSGKTSSGLGLGDGDGEKDVSDKIESEDQLEDAQPAGQEKQKEEDKDCKEEDKGIEMSEDFDSKLQDVEKKPEDEDDESDNPNSDAEEQMGDTEKGADQLDKEVWSSDNEEDPPDDGEGKNEEKGDKGEKEGDQEMAAKEDEQAPQQEEEDDKSSAKKEKDEQKKDINEMNEPELDDEQVDPYHGNQPELPEPEPMDLPDDLQLDDGDGDDDEKQEENPFDIDAMKEEMPEKDDKTTETDPDVKEQQDEDKKDDEDGSGDEDDVEPNKNENNEEMQEENPDDKEETSKKDVEEMDVDEDNQEESQVSGLDENQTQEEAQSTEDTTSAADNAQTKAPQQQQTARPNEEVQQEDNPDKEGVGQSQMEDSQTGHKGRANAEQDSQKLPKPNEDLKRKNKPSEADSDRSLGNTTEPVKKKMKSLKADDAEVAEDRGEEEEKPERKAEMYQHIKDAKKSSEQILDTVTKEQADNLKEKEVPNVDEECEKPMDESRDVPEESDEEVEVAESSKQKAEQIEKDKSKKGETKHQHPEGDVDEMHDVQIEGDVIETHTVLRSAETTHHTQYATLTEGTTSRLSVKDMNDLRNDVENQLSVWHEAPTSSEAEQTWEKISCLVSALAQDLSEQLRLVLEPTQASRLRGDFRTGRRINMRKVIPYIASQFRKDKIWLRRTKPSKREYQIVLAIDDSSSMADNHSKELAFESVALISKALTLLESGQLSILSFGERTEVLHKLTDPFTEKSGSKLLQKFKFDQKKTCVAKLVDFSTEMLNSAHSSTSSLLAKLLVIVSDGRGIFSEGESFVQQAVRRARLSNIFMIFVIVDNPQSSSSILDIRKPVFREGKVMEIKSYMDSFPFPFYIILRDINTLPHVLSDALRQWFEIVSNID